MFIRDLNQQGQTKIDKINKLLSEEFGMSIKTSYPKKEKLDKILEMSEMAIVKLKDTKKQFQLEPEYAKYLGIKDVMKTMIAEGMYAESPANIEMREMLCAEVESLMDGGCTESEAVSQCMLKFRKSDMTHSDDYILPMIKVFAREYMESSGGSHNEAIEEVAEGPNSDMNETLLSELAKEMGIDLTHADSMDAIEERLNQFATVSGKSKDSVVGFLNGLEEDAVAQGIKFFGAKIAKENFAVAAADAEEEGKKEFEYPKGSGKMHPVTIKKKNADQINKESMFDSIIDEMLSEEVESVEEAEVVMAVRALADDIQDHVERLGRMVNEDLPAIADQMVNEFGADKAASFKSEAEGVLNSALESSKQAKDGVNQLVGSITGEDMGLMGGDDMGGIEDPIGADSPIDDMEELPEPEMDVNEPAAAGPEEEPLGRAPVEV